MAPAPHVRGAQIRRVALAGTAEAAAEATGIQVGRPGRVPASWSDRGAGTAGVAVHRSRVGDPCTPGSPVVHGDPQVVREHGGEQRQLRGADDGPAQIADVGDLADPRARQIDVVHVRVPA